MSYIINHNYSILPTDIPKCVLWIDAMDARTVTLSSGTVSRLLDKSSNAYILSNGTGYAYNSTGVLFNNMYPSFYYPNNTGVSAILGMTSSLTLSQPCSIYILGQKLTTGQAFIVDTASPFGVNRIQIYSGNGYVYAQGTQVMTFNTNLLVSKFIYTSLINSSNTVLYANGNIYYNSTNVDVGTFGFTSPYGMQIGNRYSFGSNSWDGHICEILMYSNIHTPLQQQKIEGYLGWKWGLSSNLSNIHPYYKQPFVPNIQNTILPIAVKNTYHILPTDIPGCRGWFDAMDPLNTGITPSTGTSISTWYDKSGNGNNASNNAGVYPVMSTNCVSFSGTSAYLNFVSPNNLVQSTSFTVFIVEQRQTTSTTFMLGGTGTTINTNLHCGYNPQTLYYMGFYGGNDVIYTVPSFTTLSTEPTRLWTNEYIYTNRNIYLNGSIATTSTITSTLSSWSGGCIGGLPANSFKYMGNINEIIFYRSSLSVIDRQNVEGYLSWKWGLQSNLPTTHPYKYNSFVPNLIQTTITNVVKKYVYSPNSISSLALWLDAADPTTITVGVSTTVSQWRDKSSNAFNAISNSAQGGGLPTYLRNTNYLTFNPFAALLIPNYGYTNAWNVFVVLSNTDLGPRWLISPYIAVNIIMMGMNVGGAKIFPGLLSAADTTGIRLENTNSSDSLSAGIFSYYRSGSLIATNTTNGNVSTLNTAALGIGANGSLVAGNVIGVYNIYEILIYKTSLTTFQRQQVEGYLSWKWGLQANLPSSHPYKLFPP